MASAADPIVQPSGITTTASGGAVLPSGGAYAPTSGNVNNTTGQTTLNSSNLTQNPAVQLPTPPQVAGNGFTEGAQATIDTLNKQISDLKAQQASTDTGNLQDLFTKYLGSSSAPPSSADAYNSLYNSSGIADKQAAYTQSQNELDALNAQLQGKQYEYNTVIPNQTQQDAQGRGVTVGGLAPITEAAQRQKLLEIAPLQLQILSKQAEVTGNANILNAAQAHVDKVFQIQQQDAQAQYQYKQNVIDKIYQFASDQEKAKLDQQKTQNDQNFQLMRDAMNNAQDIAKTAMENGQSDIASQILGLDPQSPTYKQDVAKLQAKVVNKSAALDQQLKQAQIAQANAATANSQANTKKTLSEITPATGNGQLTADSANILQNINDLLNSNAIGSITGLGAYNPLNMIPGSQAQDLRAKADQVKSLLSLQNRSKLKGQGQISDFEGRLLQQASTQLNQNLSPEGFTQELKRVKGVVNLMNGIPVTVTITDPKTGESQTLTSNEQQLQQADIDGMVITYQ